jgi:hypothetical protein
MKVLLKEASGGICRQLLSNSDVVRFAGANWIPRISRGMSAFKRYWHTKLSAALGTLH